jgi:hypothetical protein
MTGLGFRGSGSADLASSIMIFQEGLSIPADEVDDDVADEACASPTLRLAESGYTCPCTKRRNRW